MRERKVKSEKDGEIKLAAIKLTLRGVLIH